MRSIVTDINISRPNDGQHYTVFFRQEELAGNMLVPREAFDRQDNKLLEAAQDYLDAHADDIPDLKALPHLENAGTVTRYLVDSSLNSSSSMVFVERHEEAANALIAELHKLDEGITDFNDVIKNLEADFQKFPILRDSIEYHSPDEYAPSNEPLLQCYTNLASTFVSSIDVARDKLITVDTEHFSEHEFQKLCDFLQKSHSTKHLDYARAENYGTIYAGDVCIDVDGHYNQQKQQAELKFSCYLPADKRKDRQYAEPVKGFAYKAYEGDCDLTDAIDVKGCIEGRNFEQFKSQLKDQLNYYAQTRLENDYPPKEVVALMSKGKFWQCKDAKEERPTCTVQPSPTTFTSSKVGKFYDDVEIIPHGFHDETEPTTDNYPVIADDSNFLYIEEDFKNGRAASENARYRLVLKDAEMDCKALGEIASTCPVQGALCSSNDFDAVHAKAKELLPMMKEAKERLDAMYETAVTIRTASSNMTNQFMQVYWNAYNSPNMTSKDDHEAACRKAIDYCIDSGATKGELLKLVDSKAPMAVWERGGKYAIRTVGEVNRERIAVKETNFGISR